MTSTTTADLATMTPAEIDEILAALMARQDKAARTMAYAEKALASKRTLSYEIPALTAKLTEARDEHRAAVAEAAPLLAEFDNRGGWSRFFIVTNNNGHVHSSTNCSTCFPTTQFGWLYTLSGASEAAMVAEYGEVACTVCFPSAPTMSGFGDGTSSFARLIGAEKAARDAEKAAKAAAKDAKAITAPDGSALRVGYDTIRTIIAAERKLSDMVQSFGWYGPTHPENFEAGAWTLIEALLARGVAQDRVEAIIERAAKKVRKEGGEF